MVWLMAVSNIGIFAPTYLSSGYVNPCRLRRMTTDNDALGFWDFSTAIYAKPGVAEAVIRLQDDYRCDVNFLLLCCFCATRYRLGLTPTQIREADGLISSWRGEVTATLRNLRRTIKEEVAFTRFEGAEVVRSMVVAAEIESERVTQRLLEAYIGALSPAAELPFAAVLSIACANVQTYLTVAVGPTDASAETCLMVLLYAVFAQTPRDHVKSVWQDIGGVT